MSALVDAMHRIEGALYEATRSAVGEALLATSALVDAIRDRSARYTSDRDKLAKPASPKADLAARAAFFTIADAPKIAIPIAELAARDALPAARPLRVVDLGAGCGAMSLGLVAALRAMPTWDHAIMITAIDRDRDALGIAANAVRAIATVANPTAANPTAANTTAANTTAANTTASNPTASNPTASNPVSSNPVSSDPTASNTTASNTTASNTTASNTTASNTTASNTTASNTTASNTTASNTTASNTTASNTTASNTTASNPTASNPTASNPTASNTTASNPTASNPTSSTTTLSNPEHVSSASAPVVSITTRVDDALGATLPPCDLVVMGTLLNELPSDAARLSLVERALGAIADDGAVIIIEPALRDTTRALHVLRDAIIARGAAHVVAPCTRQGAPCPALADPTDWCHEHRTATLPPRTHELARLTHLRDDGLKFSYLVLRKSALVETGAWRIVGSPWKQKGKLEVLACSDAGRVPLRLLKRHRSQANRVLEAVEKGHVVRVGATSDGERVEITSDTPVELVHPRE